MQKIYLLLRNNNQSGPFTIEELLEQDLLPSDLIWVEGKSLAWSYASELNLLKLARLSAEGPHKPVQPTTPSSVHSMPHGKRKHHRLKRGEILPQAPSPEQQPRARGPLLASPMSSAFSAGDVERKAEELRQRALAAEQTFHHRQPTPAPTPFSPDLTGNAENDIEVVVHKKASPISIPFPQMLVGGMVIAMLVAGWYGKPLFRQKVDTVDATATPLMSTGEHTAAAPVNPQPQPAVLVDSSTLQDSAQRTMQASAAVYTPPVNPQPRSSGASETTSSATVTTPESTTSDQPAVTPKKSEPEPAVNKEPEKPAQQPVAEKKDKEPAVTQPQASATEEPKEHKRGFLKGLFKKKKAKDNEPGTETSTGEGN